MIASGFFFMFFIFYVAVIDLKQQNFDFKDGFYS